MNASRPRTEPTNVLHVIAELGVGGAETMVVEMARLGPSVGWRSTVASAPGARSDIVQEAGAEHVPLPLIRRSPLAFARAVVSLRRTMRRKRPDLVMAHNVVATLAAASARGTVTYKPPIVSVFHGVADPHYSTAARIFARSSDRVIAVSESIRGRLVSAGLPPERVHVIRNAVTIPSLPPTHQARSELGLDLHAPVALCLARLTAQKRHDVLLRAWALVPGEAILLLAGEGKDGQRLQELAAEAGIADRVHFLGVRNDVGRLLAAADVSVLASDWEGLPIAVLESMAAGVPVVCTAVDGVVEVVGAGEGVLVPRRDPAALAHALDRVLSDPEERTRLGLAAQRSVETHFNALAMIGAYAALCADVLARGADAESSSNTASTRDPDDDATP